MLHTNIRELLPFVLVFQAQQHLLAGISRERWPLVLERSGNGDLLMWIVWVCAKSVMWF